MTETNDTIWEMLSYKRPHQSQTEEEFIKRFIEPLGSVSDPFGNHYVVVGEEPIVWTAHTDTVHRDEGRQAIVTKNGWIGLAAGEKSNCLGADDTAGVWLLREMIKAGKPGVYIFHRGEELGCLGSRYTVKLLQQESNLFGKLKAVISLDRRGKDSVVTHQVSGRCCSDAFADSLAALLGGDFARDPGGIYTDSDSYTGVVGECTNLSVGYDHQHSSREVQSTSFLFDLRKKLIDLDTSKLVFERQPGEIDPDDRIVNWQHWYRDFGDYDGFRRIDEFESNLDSTSASTSFRDKSTPRLQDYVDLVRENPAEVADLLLEYGITRDDVVEYIYREKGYLVTNPMSRATVS